MVFNFQEAAVKPFAHFSYDILIKKKTEERGVRRFAGWLGWKPP